MVSYPEGWVVYGNLPERHMFIAMGANSAGFMKVAQAMLEQGII